MYFKQKCRLNNMNYMNNTEDACVDYVIQYPFNRMF